MVLALIAAYGIIIGTILGTGHALHHMSGEPEATGSVETFSVLSGAEMELEKNNIPIDTLSELEEEQSVLTSKTLISGEPSNDDKSVRKQTGITVVDEMMTKPSMTPASFVTPNNIEDGVKRNVETDSDMPKAGLEKPYDVFEAVGFEDDKNFENWAK